MVTQIAFENGHVIVWAVLLVSYFVYGRMDVGLVASGRNGFQLEAMMGNVYAMFANQIMMAVTLVVFPIVMALTGVHWLWIITGTVLSLSIGIVTLLMIRKIATSTAEVMSERQKDERYNHENCKTYRSFKLFSWMWLVCGLLFIALVYFSIGRQDMSLVADVLIWLGFVAYLYCYLSASLTSVSKMGAEESKTRTHIDKALKEKDGKGNK